MTKKQKKMLYRILAALALVLVLKLLPPLPMAAELLLYCIPYLVVGWDVLRKALLGIKNRQAFDECFLMAVATVGAFALGDYVEGCAVIIFYQIGELFQSVAVGKSRRSISALSDLHRTASYYRGRCTAGFCNVDTYFVFHCIGSFPRVFCCIPLSICERNVGIEPPFLRFFSQGLRRSFSSGYGLLPPFF